MPHDLHIIRLRGPWQLEPLERYIKGRDGRYEQVASGPATSAKATMPADWCETMGHDFRGVVRYHRKFHQPTGLEPHEKVWLIVEPPISHGFVRLNGAILGDLKFGDQPGRFDITSLLVEFNTLEIDVAHPLLDEHDRPTDDSDTFLPGGLIGDVRLEIEE